MVTLRFAKVFILCMKAALAIRALPCLSAIDYRQLRACRCIHLLPNLVSTSRSSCAALFPQSSSIEASCCAPVTILAARYRSLDGSGSATHLFTLPFSFRSSPLGEETPRKKPQSEKKYYNKVQSNLQGGNLCMVSTIII